MKKIIFAISILVFLLLLYPRILVGQVPTDKNTRALNTIVVLDAIGSLNVPLYLTERVNSSRVYSWYPTTSSFGVRAKSSETPTYIIECTYSDGKLANLKQNSCTYSIEWNNDRIYRIVKFNSGGSMVKESISHDLVLNDTPVRFESKFQDVSPYSRKNWPEGRMCFFERINNGGKAFTFLYDGQYYWIAYESSLSLKIESRCFTIMNERHGTISKSPVYHDYNCGTLFSDSYGRCRYDSSQPYFNNNEYIEEVEIKY